MELEQDLNKLLADLAVFYRKLQNYHWNVEGVDFFMVHAKLEEYYNQINAQIDEIAEHILILGGQPLGTMKDYLAIASMTEAENKKQRSSTIYTTLVADFATLLAQAIQIKEKADKAQEYTTSSLMDTYLEGYGKTIWMLKQTIA